jgi:tRNA-dihydrouridine synthase A
VHARIAILAGLSPKENRDIPPLRYEDVYRLKRDFPHLEIHINGGIKTVVEVAEHWQQTDGVMIGREAYHNPYILAEALPLFGVNTLPSRDDILSQYMEFMAKEMQEGVSLTHMTRHILGLYQGLPGARKWRQYISQNAHLKRRGTRSRKPSCRTG